MQNRFTLPHSWAISEWPESIYPNSGKRARYLIRANKDDLAREGALVRVGRELVVVGAKYERWLAKKASNVPGYECPANRETEAAV